MAPDIIKTGKPVCFGGTDPKLTKMGNPWLIRFRPNDTYSGRVIAAYGVATPSTRPTRSGPADSKRFRPRSKARRQDRNRPGLSQPEPGFDAGRALGQIVGRRHYRLLFHLPQRSGDL